MVHMMRKRQARYAFDPNPSLAEQFEILAACCPNAKGMHYGARKQYQEYAAPMVPMDNPLFQPETYYIRANKF
ncbi:hypothetical protein GCM10007937_31060 [Mesorhizobium albiziae]|nr:hypothetical protein GCM10007937_31060 [Mesorhizobium albiziae]